MTPGISDFLINDLKGKHLAVMNTFLNQLK